MVKEDSLSDTSKLCLRLHEVDGLLSKNYKMGQKVRNLYKIKKKSKDETNRKSPIGWDHKVTPDGREKAGLGLVFMDWPTGYTACLVKQNIYEDMNVF